MNLNIFDQQEYDNANLLLGIDIELGEHVFDFEW